MTMFDTQGAARPFADPVTAEVIRGTMETVCFEMATYVSRTATTPILNQSNERNATILDAQGRLAALSVGIPQFMLTSTLPVRFALEFLGADEFREGDVFVANDPYHGGGHLPDYNVFAPIYAAGDDGTRRMVLIASIQCHHGDTGGGVPGGTPFAGNILRYGLGFGYELLPDGVSDDNVNRRLTLVTEAVAWSIFGGQASNDQGVFSTAGDTIANIKVGLRYTANQNSLYVGYGRAVTGDTWYQDIFRVELRYMF